MDKLFVYVCTDQPGCVLDSLIHLRVKFNVAMIIQQGKVKTISHEHTNTCKLVSFFFFPMFI